MTAIIGAVPVHPRMRARRIAIEKDKTRRRFRWFIAVAVLLAVVSGGVVFLKSSWMDIDGVEVSGSEKTSEEAILEAAGIVPGTSMLDLDLRAARDAVAKLPWVNEVYATADWTGAVALEVTERLPVAQVATTEGYSVVDAEGRVVTLSADPYPNLAVISGLNGAGAGGWLGSEALDPITVAAAVGPRLQPHVGNVTAEPGAEIYLELNRGGRVRVGDIRDLDAKMVALETLIDQVEMACVGVIDVRAPAAPVITRVC